MIAEMKTTRRSLANMWYINDFEEYGKDAIQTAVDECAESGGGEVVVPEGEWQSGAIHLKSNVHLRLKDGAVIAFSDKYEDYLPAVFTRWEGVECYNENIDLAVGLPPEHYGVLKDKFARYFKKHGAVNFTYKDKPYTIFINNVLVFPQAYAAVVPQSSLVVNTLRVFIVDIGGYTTDVLLLRNGKPDLQFCRSLETGIITMNNEIVRKVGSLHDMLIEDEHISTVLSGKETILPEDVKETILGATKLHAKDILDQLRELQVDLRSNPAIFIGGGSILLRPFLEESPLVAKASFVESPNANALGYEILARKQLSMRSA